LVRKYEEMKLLGGLDERGGIILKWILQKLYGGRGLDSSDSGEGPMVGFANTVMNSKIP
jgi:hypothetical protein